jgi:hypothetical protein
MAPRSIDMTSREPSSKLDSDAAERIYRGLLIVLHIIMAVELAALLIDGLWLNGLLVFAIMALTIAPILLRSRLPVKIPSEFQILTIIFVFASLFLGEVQSWYQRFWWWDLGLHASSGLLFGVLGFLLVHVLNENERIEVHMRPRFVALFAFVFAVAVGTLWEVFEFGVDRLFHTTMQKPSLGDPSGLTDTMGDLIINAVSACVISVFGWWYLRSEEQSFIERWIEKFIRHNRHLFRDSDKAGSL